MIRILPFVAVFALLLAGCAKEEQATTDPTATSTTSTPDKKTSISESASAASTTETKTDGTIVAHRNAKGDLLCPVMNAPVKSEADAVGFQDYEGTRYYFCCGGCPDKFKADPAKYAKK